MVTTTRYSVIFQKIPSRVRVAQKIPSSIRVAGTRWGLLPSPVWGHYHNSGHGWLNGGRYEGDGCDYCNVMEAVMWPTSKACVLIVGTSKRRFEETCLCVSEWQVLPKKVKGENDMCSCRLLVRMNVKYCVFQIYISTQSEIVMLTAICIEKGSSAGYGWHH